METMGYTIPQHKVRATGHEGVRLDQPMGTEYEFPEEATARVALNPGSTISIGFM